jgi:hypothetical protein
MTITLSANADTLIRCADFAAMRAALGLTSLATTIPGTGVASALGMPVNTPGGFYTSDPSSKANLVGPNTFTGGRITIENSDSPAINIRRLTTGTGTVVTQQLTAVTTGDAINGFGPLLTFRIEDPGISNSTIGAIGFLRSENDDETGDFVVRCQVAGIATERLRVKSSGEVIVTAPTMLKPFVFATLPAASDHLGGIIYLADESGGPTVAYSNGTNWKRVYDNANVS